MTTKHPSPGSPAGTADTPGPAKPRRRRLGWPRLGRPHRLLFPLVFILVCFASVWLAQVSVYPNLIVGAGQASRFVFGAWIGLTVTDSHGLMVVASLAIVALLYLLVLALTNLFWLSSGLIFGLALVFSTVDYLKELQRSTPLQPSDLFFVGEDGGGSIFSFVPAGGQVLTWIMLVILLVVLAGAVWLTVVDRPRGWLSWRTWRGLITRALIVILTSTSLTYTGLQVGDSGSVAARMVTALGQTPASWDPTYDYRINGAILAFIRYLNVDVMDKPAGYSKATMTAIEQRYAGVAAGINQDRTGALSDQTVIFVLCESCTPPSMVPNLTVSPDPTPFLDSLDSLTTSGTMLSTGYGGGTANIEYQALTGLSMGLFSPQLTTPYQQYVPNASYTPSAANWWPVAQAIHTFVPTMYSRQINYAKFGFARFWTTQEPDVVDCRSAIGAARYISDACAYRDALDALQLYPDNQFIHLITMQNHSPYAWAYPGQSYDISGDVISDQANATEIRNFTEGMGYTDAATRAFIEQIDALDRPVTVVWYGDHQPGIYNRNLDDLGAKLQTYETRYFIYSNPAARGHGVRLANSAYSSSNFFLAQVADQTSSRVNPYLALLTELNQQFGAIGVSVADATSANVEADQRSAGDLLLLDQAGQPIDRADLTATQRQLLTDYTLVQYDMTAGQHYIKDNGFMTFPAS